MYESVAVLAALVAVYSIISGGLEKTLIGGPITFVIAGFALGNKGLGILDIELHAESLKILAELTLAFLLFVDASSVDLGELSRREMLPRRMLLLGLPGAILLGFLLGLPLFTNLPVIEIALLSTILAPTDAALGKAVATDPTVPIKLRTTLNVESGLNDGLCVPIFLTFLAIATNATGDLKLSSILLDLLLQELGGGILVGVVVVVICRLLIAAAEARSWNSDEWRPAIVPAMAIGCFCAAQGLGGSGFIASFVGGLIFGGLMRERTHVFTEAADATGNAVAMLTWVIFGATVIGAVFAALTWQAVIYALLSLTVVRILPIWLSLRQTDTTNEEALFMGWFGPRGLASIVFAIMAVDSGLPGASTIAVVVACTIVLSVVAHGVSAKPFATLLIRRSGDSRGSLE